MCSAVDAEENQETFLCREKTLPELRMLPPVTLNRRVTNHHECYDCCSQLNCDQCLKGHKTLEVLADELLAGEVLAGGVLAVDF